MKYALALLLATATPAFAQVVDEPTTNIFQYLGRYELARDRLGLCAPSIRVWSSEGVGGESFQIWVGDYFFRAVNAGTQRFDNDFEKGTANSVYRNDTLTFDRKWFHKIKRVNERQRVQATFRGKNLRIVSKLWGAPPTERDCSYRRLPETEDDFGGDIDTTGGRDFGFPGRR